MKLILGLLIVLSLTGCNNEVEVAKNVNDSFDLPSFIDDLRANMTETKGHVSKSFTLNSKSETIQITNPDSTFWQTELATLGRIDLNSPRLSAFVNSQTGIRDTLSNLLIDGYSLTDHNVAIKSLRVYYLKTSDDVRIIQAELHTNNFIAESNSIINLWLNRYNDKLLIDSITLTGRDKTILMAPRNYTIITKTEWME